MPRTSQNSPCVFMLGHTGRRLSSPEFIFLVITLTSIISKTHPMKFYAEAPKSFHICFLLSKVILLLHPHKMSLYLNSEFTIISLSYTSRQKKNFTYIPSYLIFHDFIWTEYYSREHSQLFPQNLYTVEC